MNFLIEYWVWDKPRSNPVTNPPQQLFDYTAEKILTDVVEIN